MLKLTVREKMKRFIHIFLLVFCVLPDIASAQVATTAGSNLTAWNGNMGATNNNEWNMMMNPRGGMGGAASAPVADFGNCNALILRCAQPKCAGCTTMDVARPIVAGCVNSNATCKKHGDALIDYITAQMVSTAQSKAQEAQIQAQAAAAQAAAAESNAQMQQMQQQMAQMQQQMAQQNQQQMEQMQAALEQQKAMTEAALAEAAAAKQETSSSSGGDKSSDVDSADISADGSVRGALTAAQKQAAAAGVDADILVREQISGQILTEIENAEIALKKLEEQMHATFTYAGCDVFGNNCAGPKRVKKFKSMAQEYFRPYDEVVDSAYESLEMALAVGVDVSDVIMMLSGACNRWGKFLCVGIEKNGDSNQAKAEGLAKYDNENCRGGKSIKTGYVKGGFECTKGMIVPPQDDVRCTVTEFIGGTGDEDKVLREWVAENDDMDQLVRVGCASSALDTLAIFGRRKSRRDSGSTMDLDTLERILAQDAPEIGGKHRYMRTEDEQASRVKYCSMSSRGYETLRGVLASKKLPKKICVPYDSLERSFLTDGGLSSSAYEGSGLGDSGVIPNASEKLCKYLIDRKLAQDSCDLKWNVDGKQCVYNSKECKVQYGPDNGVEAVRQMTLNEKMERGCKAGWVGTWDAKDNKCDCGDGKQPDPNTYQCVESTDIKDAECAFYGDIILASVDNKPSKYEVKELGKICMGGGQALFDIRVCDPRDCDDKDGRVRRYGETFSGENGMEDNSWKERCCVCESSASSGKVKPFNPAYDNCNDGAENWKYMLKSSG